MFVVPPGIPRTEKEWQMCSAQDCPHESLRCSRLPGYLQLGRSSLIVHDEPALQAPCLIDRGNSWRRETDCDPDSFGVARHVGEQREQCRIPEEGKRLTLQNAQGRITDGCRHLALKLPNVVHDAPNCLAIVLPYEPVDDTRVEAPYRVTW